MSTRAYRWVWMALKYDYIELIYNISTLNLFIITQFIITQFIITQFITTQFIITQFIITQFTLFDDNYINWELYQYALNIIL